MNGGETLLYAAYPLLEVQRQRQQWLSAYAAAVSLGEHGVLLLGKSGAGKTSVVIDLCRRYGAQLIGNDLAILGLKEEDLFVKGGTKFLFLRFESIRRSLPDLIKLFPDRPSDGWSHKIKVDPETLGITARLSPAPVKLIVSLHIDDQLPALHVQAGENLATKLFLIENFSRYIKGSCSNVLGGEGFEQLGFIPSYDGLDFYDFRRNLVKVVLTRIKYVSGPLNLVTDYIAGRILQPPKVDI